MLNAFRAYGLDGLCPNARAIDHHQKNLKKAKSPTVIQSHIELHIAFEGIIFYDRNL